VYSFQLPGPDGHLRSGHRHFIKTRVGVQRLLERVRSCYDLHLYTMGIRPYAQAVLKVMDPKGDLFSNVVTRDDCPGMHASYVCARFVLISQ
jgi:RNA polymerase II subunit A-like phosphatase